MTKQITLKTGDVQSIEFNDQAFDLIINSYMLHIVEKPVTMLNEIERVAKPAASILITDLCRGFLSNFIKKFRTAYTLDEAAAIIQKSKIRRGNYSTDIFWWDYFIAKNITE